MAMSWDKLFKHISVGIFTVLLGFYSVASTSFAGQDPQGEPPKQAQEKPQEKAKGPTQDAPKQGAETAGKEPQAPEKPAVLNLAPALWKIETPVSTVYFLGTIHMLPETVNWVTPAITDAFAKAETLILETDPNVDDSRTVPFFIQHNGMYTSKSELKNVLGQELYAAYSARWAESGLPTDMRDMLKPWYGSIMLSVQYLQQLDLKPEHGVEAILKNQAQINDIPMRGLETTFDQLNALAGLSKKVQVQLMENTLNQLDETGKVWDEIIAAWGGGNEAQMKVALLDNMRKLPDLFQALIIKRNRSWIDSLETVIRQKGTHFVAVGAAHLVGEFSILEMLKMKGYRAVRVK